MVVPSETVLPLTELAVNIGPLVTDPLVERDPAHKMAAPSVMVGPYTVNDAEMLVADEMSPALEINPLVMDPIVDRDPALIETVPSINVRRGRNSAN